MESESTDDRYYPTETVFFTFSTINQTTNIMEQNYEQEFMLSDEELMMQVREHTADNAAISHLSDDDLWIIFEIWDEYITNLSELGEEDSDSDEVEIDSDDFYDYLMSEIEDNEDADFALPKDDAIELINVWLAVTSVDYDEVDDEE